MPTIPSTFCYCLCLSNISPAPYPLEDKYVAYGLGSSDDQQLYERTKCPFTSHSAHRTALPTALGCEFEYQKIRRR